MKRYCGAAGLRGIESQFGLTNWSPGIPEGGFAVTSDAAVASRQQVTRPNLQSFRQLGDVNQGDISLSSLNSTNIVAVQAALMAQFFLRPSFLLAELAEDGSHNGADFVGFHALNHTYK